MASSPVLEEKGAGTPKQRRKDNVMHSKKRHARRLAGRSSSLSNLDEAYQRPRAATVASGSTPRSAHGGLCAPRQPLPDLANAGSGRQHGRPVVAARLVLG